MRSRLARWHGPRWPSATAWSTTTWTRCAMCGQPQLSPANNSLPRLRLKRSSLLCLLVVLDRQGAFAMPCQGQALTALLVLRLCVGHVCVPAPGPCMCELDVALAPRQPMQQVRPSSRCTTAGEVSLTCSGCNLPAAAVTALKMRGGGQVSCHCQQQHRHMCVSAFEATVTALA
jgi:hypothetical protein